jgi:hypothetical protein
VTVPEHEQIDVRVRPLRAELATLLPAGLVDDGYAQPVQRLPGDLRSSRTAERSVAIRA